MKAPDRALAMSLFMIISVITVTSISSPAAKSQPKPQQPLGQQQQQRRRWELSLLPLQRQLRAGANTSMGPYFPLYHPRPSAGHVNDPNGPMYFNGVYHLFMQHACGGGSHDRIIDPICRRMGWPGGQSAGVGWGHLTSLDLAAWTEQPVALAPPLVDIRTGRTQQQQGYPDMINTGYFTGSAQIVDGVPRLLFPAVFQAKNVTQMFPNCMIGNVTGRQNADCFFDLQMAIPKNLSDPFLRDWEIVATPFSHNIKFHGGEHNFVFEVNMLHGPR